MEWKWLLESVVLAVHEAQLAEHGGPEGIRDPNGLASALARPHNLLAYGGQQDVASLAAAYAFGIARNHPFLDGNKRTSFVVLELFLDLNGWALTASDVDCATTLEALAAGNLTEESLVIWVREHLERK